MKLFPLPLLCLPLLAEGPIRGFAPEAATVQAALEQKARAIPDPARIRTYLERMTIRPHHAGSPGSKQVAEYAVGLMKEWGLDARIEEFEGLLPWPVSRTLEMTAPKRYVAKIAEPALAGDRTSGQPGQLPPFNAYSGSGDVTAPLVYVNFGVPEDYEWLKSKGIDVKGKIVIARYGGSWRGVKPKLAAENGAVGCIIYSDPHEDGYFQGDTYPKGPYRPEMGAQRGSVLDMSIYPGDPLSPGWASEKGSKRLALADAKTLQKIPVLPISWGDAKPMLEQLAGPVAPEGWRGALPITYHVGPGPAAVRLAVTLDNTSKPIYNVIARIEGAESPGEWVIYGNHHDAWVSGASDPGSGAASLIETARTLAELRKTGWKPRRTIILALWDAEEFGLVGSTEWVEKHAAELSSNAVAYINSDSTAKGVLSGGGSQSFELFMQEVLRDVPQPGSTKSVLQASLEAPENPRRRREPRDAGTFRLSALGSGSDYTPFLHHLLIPSLNLGFSSAESGGGGVYHSTYDSFDWYTKFSDGDFTHGKALSQVMVTSLLRLAEAPVVPLEFTRLGYHVKNYLKEIDQMAADKKTTLDTASLRQRVESFEKAAALYEESYVKASSRMSGAATENVRRVNALLRSAERTLGPDPGLPGREWFRHQLYAPGRWTGYAAKTLPAIREAIEGNRWDEARGGVESVRKSLDALEKQIRDAAVALAAL